MPRKLSNYANRTGKERDRKLQVGAVPHGHADGGYTAAREAEAETRNARLAERVKELESLLAESLGRYADVPIGERRSVPTSADLPAELHDRPAPERADFEPEPHGMLGGLLSSLAPGAAEKRAEAEAAFETALAEWRGLGARREAALARARSEADAYNREVDRLEAALAAGAPEAVEAHARRVLEASPWPKGFPKAVTTRFEPETAKLAVTLTAPGLDEVVPKAEAYRFVPQRDEVFAIRRGETERTALHERILAQMALRAMHEVFSTDPERRIGKVRVSLYIDAIDPATGRATRPQVLSVRASRKTFEELDLSRVDPAACVRRLKGMETPALSA